MDFIGSAIGLLGGGSGSSTPALPASGPVTFGNASSGGGMSTKSIVIISGVALAALGVLIWFTRKK